MSFKIVLPGVAAAIGLGLLIGGHMRPTLATRGEEPVSEAFADVGGGAVDLTPAYVSPASLQSWRAAEAPTRVEPDRIDIQVRRELAQANAELRASEAALEDYHRAAVLVTSAGAIGDDLTAVFSPAPEAAPQGSPEVAADAWRQTSSPPTQGSGVPDERSSRF